jgi:hypothetical protein
MNNNLPDDINKEPNQNKVDDTNIESNENSNLHAVPVTATNAVPKYDDSYVEAADENDVTYALSSLENIIRNRLGIIEKSQLEVSELGQQLKDIMANSEEYYKADKVAKEAMKVKKQIKSTIMSTPEAKMIQGKYDDAKETLKDNEGSLSDLLLEYYETMRIKAIDDGDGNERELLIKVRVAPKKMKQQ